MAWAVVVFGQMPAGNDAVMQRALLAAPDDSQSADNPAPRSHHTLSLVSKTQARDSCERVPLLQTPTIGSACFGARFSEPLVATQKTYLTDVPPLSMWLKGMEGQTTKKRTKKEHASKRKINKHSGGRKRIKTGRATGCVLDCSMETWSQGNGRRAVSLKRVEQDMDMSRII
eukprot:2465054-Amphidinium_carterae.2